LTATGPRASPAGCEPFAEVGGREERSIGRFFGAPRDGAGNKRLQIAGVAVASGKKTKSELGGVGEEEFAPWSIGPTL
jgi:hypothetical protein